MCLVMLLKKSLHAFFSAYIFIVIRYDSAFIYFTTIAYGFIIEV